MLLLLQIVGAIALLPLALFVWTIVAFVMYPLVVIPTYIMLFYVYIKKTITWNPFKKCRIRCCCSKANRVSQNKKPKAPVGTADAKPAANEDRPPV